MRTYKKGTWKLADSNCYTFFRDRAQKNRPAPPPSQNTPTKIGPDPNRPPIQARPVDAKKVVPDPQKIVPEKVEPETAKSPPKKFALEPVKELVAHDLTDMRKIVKGVKFVESAPEPGERSKRIADAPVLVVTDARLPPNHQLFLANLAKALEGAALVQQSALGNIDPNKQIICPKNLATPDSAISIEEPTTYLKEPLKKRKLYADLQKICRLRS